MQSTFVPGFCLVYNLFLPGPKFILQQKYLLSKDNTSHPGFSQRESVKIFPHLTKVNLEEFKIEIESRLETNTELTFLCFSQLGTTELNASQCPIVARFTAEHENTKELCFCHCCRCIVGYNTE